MFPPTLQPQGSQVVMNHAAQPTRFLIFQASQVGPRVRDLRNRPANSWVTRYIFRSTGKATLQETTPRFTLKLRSPWMGLPAAKDFWEP